MPWRRLLTTRAVNGAAEFFAIHQLFRVTEPRLASYVYICIYICVYIYIRHTYLRVSIHTSRGYAHSRVRHADNIVCNYTPCDACLITPRQLQPPGNFPERNRRLLPPRHIFKGILTGRRGERLFSLFFCFPTSLSPVSAFLSPSSRSPLDIFLSTCRSRSQWGIFWFLCWSQQ